MLILYFALANALHPVREEIVEDIKLKATSWKPKEVSQNHLRNTKDIAGLLGSLGLTPY